MTNIIPNSPGGLSNAPNDENVVQEFENRGFNFVEKAVEIYNGVEMDRLSGAIEPADGWKLQLDVVKAFLPYRYTSKKLSTPDIKGDVHQTINVIAYDDTVFGRRQSE